MTQLFDHARDALWRYREPLKRLRSLMLRHPATRGVARRLDQFGTRFAHANNLQQAFGFAPTIDVNVLLHQSRTAFLRIMPRGARRLLSAGCAGRWYFDWMAQSYGPVEEHIGIEYYVDPPSNLPANATWIRNTVGNMSAVEDRSCDLVFSGQNLEHLWPEEVAGFLLEAARTLRPGGYLVMDSPNRDLTARLIWSHPEHTIEVTPAEATKLLRLAGFDVKAMKGIYLCRDPRSGRVLPFDPNQPDPEFSLTERLVVAVEQPQHSFIWWAEAMRANRAPDSDAVRATADALFREHWPERFQRLVLSRALSAGPTSAGAWVEVPASHVGAVFYGPYIPLRAGRYRATWTLRSGDRVERFAVCEVMAGDAVLASVTPVAGEDTVALDFELPTLTFGLQFRCVARGGAAFAVRRHVELGECCSGGAH
jgi:SAM-dependent methyltransferase